MPFLKIQKFYFDQFCIGVPPKNVLTFFGQKWHNLTINKTKNSSKLRKVFVRSVKPPLVYRKIEENTNVKMAKVCGNPEGPTITIMHDFETVHIQRMCSLII